MDLDPYGIRQIEESDTKSNSWKPVLDPDLSTALQIITSHWDSNAIAFHYAVSQQDMDEICQAFAVIDEYL